MVSSLVCLISRVPSSSVYVSTSYTTYLLANFHRFFLTWSLALVEMVACPLLPYQKELPVWPARTILRAQATALSVLDHVK